VVRDQILSRSVVVIVFVQNHTFISRCETVYYSFDILLVKCKCIIILYKCTSGYTQLTLNPLADHRDENMSYSTGKIIYDSAKSVCTLITRWISFGTHLLTISYHFQLVKKHFTFLLLFCRQRVTGN